jgi:hypothetical protein
MGMKARPLWLAVSVTLAVCGLSTKTFAQSAIAGVVRDASGAVLPGVTVEAASPALIEKSRTVVTDAAGQYRVIDLRPGSYSVTFSLEGFTTVKRDGLELPANFTLALNADMKVGALEETITVSGAAPSVDVQSTSRTQLVSKDALDAIPTSRSIQSVGQLVVGIQMDIPDVGGSRNIEKGDIVAHNLPMGQNTIEIDGFVSTNTADTTGSGANPYYYPQAFIQEAVYETGNVGPDAAGAGVRINWVPRDGGNSFHGDAFLAGYPKSFIGSNVTPALRTAGLGLPNQTTRFVDSELALGGPLKRDQVWFFGDVRAVNLKRLIAGTYDCVDCYGKTTAPSSGSQGLDSGLLMPVYGRLTWQMSPRNKLAAYSDWTVKYRDGFMNPGNDPRTSRGIFNYDSWPFASYVAAVKWTSTLTNKFLIEAGVSPQHVTYSILPGDLNGKYVLPQRGTADWYAKAVRTDLNLGTQWGSYSQTYDNDTRYYYKGAVTYNTGTHTVRGGLAYDVGEVNRLNDANADLTQQYVSGAPTSVQALNTPRPYTTSYQVVAPYLQDVLTVKRLTVNAGLRFEYVNGANEAKTAPAGRFVPERSFPRVADLPNWKTWAPRLGAVYDLFGTAKTALKASLNRFDSVMLNSYATTFNPLAGANASATLSWIDLNGDDIAQGELGCVYLTPGCEINFTQLPKNFGVRSLSTPDPNTKRPYYIESSVGVQQEIARGTSFTLAWTRRTLKNNLLVVNSLLSASDYTAVNAVSPIDGSAITLYNLNANKLGQVANIQTTDSQFRDVYNDLELTVSSRIKGGGTIFGGYSSERSVKTDCNHPDNPNLLLFCDQSKSDIPWRQQIKVSGALPLPWWGFQVAGTFQGMPGYFLPGGLTQTGPQPGTINWQIVQSTRYAANCPGSCTPGALVIPGMTTAQLVVPLTAGNTQFTNRVNQMDLSGSKSIKLHGAKVQVRFDVFNVLNANPVLAVRSVNFGTPAYLQVASIMDARTFRIGAQLTF